MKTERERSEEKKESVRKKKGEIVREGKRESESGAALAGSNTALRIGVSLGEYRRPSIVAVLRGEARGSTRYQILMPWTH